MTVTPAITCLLLEVPPEPGLAPFCAVLEDCEAQWEHRTLPAVPNTWPDQTCIFPYSSTVHCRSCGQSDLFLLLLLFFFLIIEAQNE